MDQDFKELRLHYQAFHREAAIYWNNHANLVFQEINKQLLAFSIAIVSGALVASFTIDRAVIQSYQIATIVFLLISVIVSLLFGIAYLFKAKDYFLYLSYDESDRQQIWETAKSESEARLELRKLKKTNPYGDVTFFKFQLIFFVQSLVLMVIVLMSFLIN